MELEHFIYKDKKRLRYGYTTGSCATGATMAAVTMLLSGDRVNSVGLQTKKGIYLSLEVCQIEMGKDKVSCAVKKNSGDDPDVTNGVLVYAQVRKLEQPGIVIDGGIGVGRVTRAGLDCEVGAAAINSKPRESIKTETEKICKAYNYRGGIEVIISIPEGVEIAKKTFNPRLGIVGGISVLGTSGIVEPMSEAALIDSVKVEMRMLYGSDKDLLVLTPGNYGENFIRKHKEDAELKIVKCSNFIGESLEYAAELGFKRILLIGHIGKLIKLAGGMMNTHSKYGDCRMEIMSAHTALNGGGRETVKKIMSAVTTDEALAILDEVNLRKAVLTSLMEKIMYHINIKTGSEVEIDVLIFSNKLGALIQTDNADKI